MLSAGNHAQEWCITWCGKLPNKSKFRLTIPCPWEVKCQGLIAALHQLLGHCIPSALLEFQPVKNSLVNGPSSSKKQTKIIITFSFMCDFSKLQQHPHFKAHYKAKNQNTGKTNLCSCEWVGAHTRTHAHTHARARTHARTHACTRTHTHTVSWIAWRGWDFKNNLKDVTVFDDLTSKQRETVPGR